MPGSAHYHQLAFYQETVQGEGPANAAAWLAAVAAPPSAFRIAPLVGSFNTSAIGPGLVDDDRAYDDIFDDEGDLVGIDNPEFTFESYAETNGAAAASGSQIGLTWQMALAQHALGGLHRGTTRVADTAAGSLHSTTQVEVNDDTGILVGGHVAITLANYTGLGGATVAHVRRVTAINSATNLITLDQALPATPVDDDVVGACATAYVDSTALRNSVTGPVTMSWHISRDQTSGTANWEILGAKAQLVSLSAERDDFAKLAWKVLGGSSAMPNDAASPAWVTDPENEVPFQIGRYTQLWLQDYGTTTSTLHGASQFTVEDFGVPVVPADTITSITAGMQGRSGYSTTRGDTMVAVTIREHDSNWWTEYEARAYKVARFANLAPRGGGFAVTLPRCQIQSRPDFVGEDGSSANSLKLKGFRDLSSVATTQLARSKICLVWF